MTNSELVSIIVPCYNEEKTIGLLLDAIRRQTYPLSQMEVILADGKSSDQTLARVAEFQQSGTGLDVIVIQNSRRIIPAGLNLAIQAAHGEYIVRLDAHSVPDENYVERCVANLKDGKGDNVGGLWLIQPGEPGWIAQSIALAAGHPLGVGDARYRYSNVPGEVDTVPFGSFHRDLFDRVGLYDEALAANEDYELNARIRAINGKIFFDPSIRTKYYSRPTLGALARQYWRYGYWKWRMLKRYPGTLRWRQALPPMLVLGTGLLLILSIWFTEAWVVLLTGIGLYLLLLIGASVSYARNYKDWRFLVGIPLSIATMHYSWGSGFLWSIIHSRG